MVFSFRCGKVVFHWRWMTFSLFKLSDPFLVLRFTLFGTSNKASEINSGQVTLLHFIDECVCYNSLHQWQFYGSRLDSRFIFWEISIVMQNCIWRLNRFRNCCWLSGRCDAPESGGIGFCSSFLLFFCSSWEFFVVIVSDWSLFLLLLKLERSWQARGSFGSSWLFLRS